MKTTHILHKMLAAATLALAAIPAFGLTLEGTFNGTTRYVSKSGSDANDGLSWDTAKLTIQAAVNLCANGDTVIVDDGEYSDTTPWTSASDSSKTLPTVVQITKRIRLVSRNGKYKTHIVGKWATTSTGVGSGAARCIYVKGTASASDAANGTLIEGFTIRDGATEASTAGNTDYDSAGGICGGTGNNGKGLAYVVDCDVVNCRAGTGAALSRGIVPIRCAFFGNRGVNAVSTQHVFYRTLYAYNCVLAMNGPPARTVSTSGGSIFAQAQSMTAVNCTFIDNTCYALQPTGAYPSPIYNCAFLGDGEALSYGSGGNKQYIYPTNCVQTASGTDIGGRIAQLGAAAGDSVGVPEFQHWLAADTGEWKFVVNGDLKDKGYNARAIAAAFVPEEYLDTDFFGNPRNWSSVDIGAIEAQGAVASPALGTIQLGTNVAVRVAGEVVSLPRGFVSVAGGSADSARFIPLRAGDTRFVVTGSRSYSRFADGMGDGGTVLDFPASGAADTVNLAPPTGVFYVDAVNGDDANDGLSPATAKKTLAATLPSAGPGSIVHAAPGDYNEGSQTYTVGTLLLAPQDGTHSPSRGWVRAGALLVADEGPDVTFITGVIDNSNGNGLGAGAIRCITAANGSVVRGFTLRNGATFNTTGGMRDENMGGLAIALSWRLGLTGTALFEDCVFSNGYARTAGMVAGGIYRRCRFSGGHSTSGANISMYSRFEHCLLLNDTVNDTGIRYSGGMQSTTYIATKGKGNGTNVEFSNPQDTFGATFENSIIATPNMAGNAVSMKNMTNCLWVTGGGNATIDPATSANVITVATVADALAMLDAGYAPLAGTALVDAGDRALLAHLTGDATTDLGGGQRIYGGEIDIGAFEYDLRPAIAAFLNRRVAVTAAGEEVALGASAVSIPAGSLAFTVTDTQASSFTLPVEVTGTGTLSIYAGGFDTPLASFTSADGATEAKLAVDAGMTGFLVAYAPGASDNGAALIGRLASTNPFVLTIR